MNNENAKTKHAETKIGGMYALPLAVAAIVFAVLLAACASIGNPEGGPRDYQPPVFVRSTPMPGQTGVTPSRLELYFDENVSLDDAFNKVIISPVQKSTPVVRAGGRRITVELRDTLQPNTTYTIDFADAIRDLNEGNILDGFAIDFATGDSIDSLQISGIVLSARDLEPAQGITVGVTTDMSDTAFVKSPLQRIARTNQRGQFTIRNLKAGTYRIFAVNDVNRDNCWDRSEDVAFYDLDIVPSSRPTIVSDTLRSSEGTDSIVERDATLFLPNDVLLTWFNEDYHAQYIKDSQRPDRRRLFVGMGAPHGTLPTLTLVGGPRDGDTDADWALLQANANSDSLTYWIRDPELLAIDTLRVSVHHSAQDSLSRRVWVNDTINFIYRAPKVSKKKKKEEADSLNVPEREFATLTVKSQSSHEVYAPMRIESALPISRIDTTGVYLQQQVDSVWKDLVLPPLRPDSLNPLLGRVFDYRWDPGAKYRLLVDSAAVTSIYDSIHNKALRHEFTIKKLEEYSNLAFTIKPSMVDGHALCFELLNNSDKVMRTVPVDTATGKVVVPYITPGTYYARVFIDANGNGRWDTGNFAERLQPEEVAYFDKKLELKANWDNELAWDIYAKAIDTQKPYAILKNKPKLKPGEKAPDQEEELDEWGEPINRGGSRRGTSRQGLSLPVGRNGLQTADDRVQRR